MSGLIILPGKSSKKIDDQVIVLDHETEDAGEWLDYGNVDPVVEPVLWLLMQQMDVEFDPTIPTDVAQAKEEIGYREMSWSFWMIGVNYSREWKKSLPPWHIGVQWKDTIIGMLSPLVEMRTCWKCGVTGWHEFGASYRLKNPNGPKRVARCRPRYPCMGHPDVLVDGKVVTWKDCGALDWYGEDPRYGFGISREQLQQDAAERLARMENDDRLEVAMAEEVEYQ